MISAIVTSLNRDNLLATPSSAVELSALVGRRARYVDKAGKIWPATIVGEEDPFVVVKFDEFPSGLGQGQLLDIMEDGDDINQV